MTAKLVPLEEVSAYLKQQLESSNYRLTNLAKEREAPRPYLEVKYRLALLRHFYPGAICTTSIIPTTDDFAVARASVEIENDEGRVIARGEGIAAHISNAIAKDKYANASTSALGRAIANLFGLQEMLEDFDEPKDAQGRVSQPAEAPVQPRSQAPKPDLTFPGQPPIQFPHQPKQGGMGLATEKQIKMMKAIVYGEYQDWKAVSQWLGDEKTITFDEARAACDYLKNWQNKADPNEPLPDFDEIVGRVQRAPVAAGHVDGVPDESDELPF